MSACTILWRTQMILTRHDRADPDQTRSERPRSRREPRDSAACCSTSTASSPTASRHACRRLRVEGVPHPRRRRHRLGTARRADRRSALRPIVGRHGSPRGAARGPHRRAGRREQARGVRTDPPRRAGEDDEVAYMGDDLLDLPVLARVGLSAAPADAAPEVRERVDWVSHAAAGRGAARELVELVLRAQQRWDDVVRQHCPRRNGRPTSTSLPCWWRCSPAWRSARHGSATSCVTASGSTAAARASLRTTCSASTFSSPTRSIRRSRN